MRTGGERTWRRGVGEGKGGKGRGKKEGTWGGEGKGNEGREGGNKDTVRSGVLAREWKGRDV